MPIMTIIIRASWVFRDFIIHSSLRIDNRQFFILLILHFFIYDCEKTEEILFQEFQGLFTVFWLEGPPRLVFKIERFHYLQSGPS